MMRNILCAGLVLLATTADTALAGRWIHVRVKEYSGDGETVKINFPLRSAAKLIALVDDDDIQGGRIRFNDRDMDAEKLRAIWEAVREAEDGEFVTVESESGEDVRVSRDGEYLLVKVEDRDGRRSRRVETVDIRMPITVVDALLSGNEDELNIAAAIEALDRHGPGEIISVDDEDSQVRIWVDESQSGEKGRGR